ncbi:DUF4870 domain-containing protein [Staphylococcus hominis]|uniref:DUF4870 domain-containing protein n=1 Tax=Staphylococcus hominis TaxID=1290 RepID=UPI001188C8A6|nr:DUF4870 domain-containing protein [Staphylococcus hominis]QDW87835.1 DUF4870 domain-containing protein [Staphylococcus hominis]
MSNSSEKLLASLCYFSVFFAPFLFPIIVWILAEKPVTTHAKKSIIFHILPWLMIAVSTIFLALTENHYATSIYFIIWLIFLAAAFFLYIYNLYCGIKVLLVERL